MKRVFWVLLICLLLAGCSGQNVDLMPDVEPDTSALGLYIWDGETVTRQFLFEDTAVREKAMADFRSAKAEPAEVDVTTLQPPYYGLQMGGEEIGTVNGLWADGYFIMGDGSSYRFDYDFEDMLQVYPWSEADTFQNLTVMPCASYMAKTEAGWNRNFLTEAEEAAVPEGITMEIAEQTDEEIVARFCNRSGAEWGYGHAFSLQVLLEDAWYGVPAEQEMCFTEELMVLQDGGEQTETYRLTPYGDLPAGIYRIISTEGLWVEFEIE